jgi:hypothetical protein
VLADLKPRWWHMHKKPCYLVERIENRNVMEKEWYLGFLKYIPNFGLNRNIFGYRHDRSSAGLLFITFINVFEQAAVKVRNKNSKRTYAKMYSFLFPQHH